MAAESSGLARARLGVVAVLAALAVVALAGSSPAATNIVARTAAVKIAEGGKATFTVRLSRAPARPVRISYRTASGTAKSPGDFKAVSGKLVFRRGQKTKKVTVSTVNDPFDESAERFVLKLSSPRGARLRNKTATATILANDSGGPPPPAPGPPRSLTIADLAVAEGNTGTAPAVLTVSLSGTTATSVTVSYATVAGTATSGSDYTLSSGLLTIPAGQTTGQVDVPVVGDVVDEDDETLEVRLTGPSSNAIVGDDRAVLTITDDDPAVADVGVTLADAPDPVVAGGPLTYTATVTNHGSDRAPATALVDTLPSGFAFVSASASSGTCGHASGVVTCQLGMLANGATRTVTIVTEPGVSGSIPNTVSVSGAYTDGVAANDQATATTQVAAGADVSVDLTASASALLAGQSLTYSMEIANRGPFPASDPVVTNTLPAGVTFVSASPGCIHSAGTVACGAAALGASLPAGTSTTLQIVVSRSDPVDATLLDTASISISAPADPDPADNSDGTSTPYHAAGDLRLAIVNSGQPLDVGENLSWTLTLDNLGPNTTTGVSLHDSLPAGFTLESVTPSQGLCVPSVSAVDCTFGTVAPGTTITVVLAGRPAASASGSLLVNTATASSSTADPNPADNSVSSPAKVQPRVSIDDVAVVEPIGIFPVAGTRKTIFAWFTVTLSRTSAETITIAWATANGTATGGDDYIAGSGTVTLLPGELSKNVLVSVQSDGSTDVPEPNETYFVNLTSPVNVTIVDGQGLGTILD
jgi:uncharacterized repeat protein (TIGR01451 family)